MPFQLSAVEDSLTCHFVVELSVAYLTLSSNAAITCNPSFNPLNETVHMCVFYGASAFARFDQFALRLVPLQADPALLGCRILFVLCFEFNNREMVPIIRLQHIVETNWNHAAVGGLRSLFLWNS